VFLFRKSRFGIVPSILTLGLGLAAPALSLAQTTPPEAAPSVLEREALVELALTRHPALRAADARADARSQEGDASARLPAPELMAELWQVPLSRPYAIDEAGMLMFGLRQDFPAPGSLAATERAARAEADAERRLGQSAAQTIARDVRHAYADYVAAMLRERAHASHRSLAERLVSAARARLAGGAPLSELTRASFELERIEVDRAADDARIDSARAEINVLIGRLPGATLPAPREARPETVAEPLDALLSRARKRRPELAALASKARAVSAEQDQAQREATLPSFSIAALYFAPVGGQESGIGASASASLPWLWGPGSSRREQKRRELSAVSLSLEEMSRGVDNDVARAHSKLRALEARERALDGKLLPAARQRFETSLSAYGSGAGSLTELLEAREALAMAELESIDARAELEHALVDLEWATGGPLPRRTVDPASAKEHRHDR
jgi:cobalt-zinc-cadmium efflux system outer membrane protein